MGNFAENLNLGNRVRPPAIWRGSKVQIGQALGSDIKMTSYVPRLRSTFVSPKVSSM